MTIKARFRHDFLVRAAEAASPGVSGTAELSAVSAFATLQAAPGDGERKLIGVVLSELHPTAVDRQRDKRYA
jgi:hypothetical protein